MNLYLLDLIGYMIHGMSFYTWIHLVGQPGATQVLESVGKAKFGMRRYGDPNVPVNVSGRFWDQPGVVMAGHSQRLRRARVSLI